jgi:hypothetical protein
MERYVKKFVEGTGAAKKRNITTEDAKSTRRARRVGRRRQLGCRSSDLGIADAE